MPQYFALAVVGFFASLGLPTMVGFIGEVMVFLGAFQYSKLLASIAAIGLLLTAGYILWTMQRVYLGEVKPQYAAYADCNRWEFLSLAPLAALCIVFGILPMILINIYASSTEIFLALFK
jgi:NADH-quinone oxidoreductase subunit M